VVAFWALVAAVLGLMAPTSGLLREPAMPPAAAAAAGAPGLVDTEPTEPAVGSGRGLGSGGVCRRLPGAPGEMSRAESKPPAGGGGFSVVGDVL